MSIFKPKVERDEVNPEKPQPPLMAVLDSAQPLQVEGGEGKIHAMAARHATLAMRQALVEAKRHALTAADPRPFVRRHPLPTVGGAAAVGLFAALVAVPSEKQRAAQRLRAIERALRDEAAYDGQTTVGGGASLSKRAFRYALQYAKPTLVSFLTSAITGAVSGGTTASNVGEKSSAAPAGQESQGSPNPHATAGPSAQPPLDVT